MLDINSILRTVEKTSLPDIRVGDCPNVEIPIIGGEVFWKIEQEKNGWRLQKNIITGISRILDYENIQKA